MFDTLLSCFCDMFIDESLFICLYNDYRDLSYWFDMFNDESLLIMLSFDIPLMSNGFSD